MPFEAIPRQPPPADLSAFEAELWMKVVNTRPADYFTADTLPLLRSYVRHCYQAAKIDDELAKVIDQPFLSVAANENNGTPVYTGELFDRLTKMRDRESRAITALARSMRLTHQAQMHQKTAGTAARKGASASSKLWEG